MTKYGIIKVEDVKTVPLDAEISELRFKETAGGYYGYARTITWRGFHQKAIEGLKEIGVEFVKDIERMSAKDLEKANGVGPETSKKLLKAAKKAAVHYRGVGFPYEIMICVFVPDDAVEYMRDLGEKSVQGIMNEHMEADFFPSIEAKVTAAKIAKINKSIVKAGKTIRTLKKALSELEE